MYNFTRCLLIGACFIRFVVLQRIYSIEIANQFSVLVKIVKTIDV